VCWSGPDGSGCEPGDPAKLCMPPYIDVGGYPGRGEDSAGPGGTPPRGNGETPTSPGSPEPGVPATGNPPAPTPTPSEGVEENADAADADSGGCTVSAAPRAGGTSGVVFALAAALSFAVRRRLQRRARA
jgi:hypothetical protein